MVVTTHRSQEFYPKADSSINDAVLRGLATLPRQLSVESAGPAFVSAIGPVTAVRELDAIGTFHELFAAEDSAGTTRILKANRIPDSLDDLAMVSEHSASVLLTASSVRHGRVTDVDRSRTVAPFDFEVMDFVAGESFRAFDDDEDTVLARLPLLAHYLREVHGIVGDGFGLLSDLDEESPRGLSLSWNDYLHLRLDEHLRLLEGANILSAEQSSLITVALEARAALFDTVEPRLLHGDCGPHNAIVQPDGLLSMIDWEDALFGDPLFEVAMWATFNPPRRWAAFFAAYFDLPDSAAPWQPDDLFWTYFLRISVAKAVVRVRFGYRDVPGREPASLRITRALDALS